MTTKFKAGDKVVRTCEYTAVSDGGFMKKGEEYIVKELLEDNELLLEGSPVEYSCSYFKLVQPKFSNMKFRVNSPEHSKEIQEALFEMGYKVYGNLPTNINYIYTHASGSEILYGYEESTFQDYEEHQEHVVFSIN